MKKWFIMLSLVAAALAGCRLEKETEQPCFAEQDGEGVPAFPILTASWTDPGDTRTALQEDGISVWWTPSDSLFVAFCSGKTLEYYTDLGKPSPSAVFKPINETFRTGLSITLLTNLQRDELWAFYPSKHDNRNSYSNNDARCNYAGIEFTLPSVQQGKENSFPFGMPAMAKSSVGDPNGSLHFRFICGGIRFSVAQVGIQSVEFRSEKPVSGRVTAAFDVLNEGEDPYIAWNAVDDNQVETWVSVTAPEGGFIPGKYYFAILFPQSFPHGLTIRFNKVDGYAEAKLDRPLTIQRGRFGVLDRLDDGLEIHHEDDNIVFRNTEVKKWLVKHFDTDYDGELSYAEAASVKSLDALESPLTVFNTPVSFDEFQYFTGITSFDGLLFKGCYNLVSISLPPGITTIQKESFRRCHGLVSVGLPSGLARIEEYAFCECINMESVSLPSGLKWIGEGAFHACRAMTSVDLPAGVSSLESDVFGSCNNLASVTLPPNLLSIGPQAFSACRKLKTINFPESLEIIGEQAFANTALQEVILPASVSSIGDLVFATNEFLSKITLPPGLTSIPNGCFSRCYSLSSISIPETVTYIGSTAFYHCHALRKIVLPKDLRVLGSEAFGDCNIMESALLEAPIPPENVFHYYNDKGYRFENNPCKIYVPDTALETYKTDPYFSRYASRIFPLSEYAGE